MQEKIDFFNKKAHDWHYKNRDPEVHLVEEIFNQHLNSLEGNNLDIGCGTGFLHPLLHPRLNKNSNLVSLDYSCGMLKSLREKYLDSLPVQGDAHKLPFKDNSLTNIFCYNAFPHFENKEMVISEFLRILIPKGRVFIFHNMCHRKLNGIHSNKGIEVSSDKMLPVAELGKIFLNNNFNITHSEENKNIYLLLCNKN